MVSQSTKEGTPQALPPDASFVAAGIIHPAIDVSSRNSFFRESAIELWAVRGLTGDYPETGFWKVLSASRKP
jgi:hypothetical protein